MNLRFCVEVLVCSSVRMCVYVSVWLWVVLGVLYTFRRGGGTLVRLSPDGLRGCCFGLVVVWPSNMLSAVINFGNQCVPF